MTKKLKLFIMSLFLSSCSFNPNPNIKVISDYQPDIRPVKIENGKPDEYNYVLKQDYQFSFFFEKRVYRGTIPAGFTSDGTSIPWFLWSVTGITRDGLERAASWVHDWMYVNHGKVPLEVYENGQWVKSDFVLKREQVDGLFYTTMLYFQVSAKRAIMMFDAVREYGQHAWNSHPVTNEIQMVLKAPK